MNMPQKKLSDFIRDNIEPILETWEQFAHRIPSAKQMDVAALRDHASGILYAIADDLDHAQTYQQQAEKSKSRAPRSATQSDAEKHGDERLSAGFSINDVMSEFRALRASVIRLWSDSSPTAMFGAGDERTRFNEAIDQALAESFERYSRLFEALMSSSPDFHFILDNSGRFVYANQSLANLYAISPGEIVGKNFFDLGAPVASELQQQVRQAVDDMETHRGEISYSLASGKQVAYEFLFVPVVNDGTVEAIAGTARDITERKALEDEAKRKANYDALTGLPNRSLFRDRLEQEVKRAERTGLPVALLFIDLDGFKEVNDRLGHVAGDQLLKQVAQRIGTCVREADTVARLSGDEFTVILGEVHKISHIEIVAQHLCEELARPFSIFQNEVHISASIGISLLPRDATTPEDLIKSADQAMYLAKNTGRNRFSFYSIGMRDSAWARLKVIDELRHALPQHQLSVYYQPIVDLSMGTVVKAEALVRWHHPQGELMLPVAFIGLAEEIGLIGEIDDWVLGEAMVCARDWSNLLGAPFQISVNKSPVEFMRKVPMTSWGSQLKALGLAWNSISVEITEGVLLQDSPQVTERLENLHKAGAQLTIDDFGAGYSSMAYLKKFDVDFLKIDQSFVQDMSTSMNSRIIAEAIIVMAHKLGLKVIAEGVETAEQRDWLKAAECDYAQGYFYSEAVPSGDFEKLLQIDKARQSSTAHQH